ncbi:hypothetical protein ABZ357_38715 [Streptomyces sp. NPDC005917]|uniref:hypothetical protein n=1 Tax=unclassified Streptomyces TaxID=2593676 RepID=UPI0033EEBFC3
MPTASRTSRSYQADVLLVPLEPRARAAVAGPDPLAALAGITIAGTDPQAGDTRHDVVVMLAHDLPAVAPGLVARLGASAHEAGALVGAIIVSPDRTWRGPEARRAAAALRAAADTVVVLSGMAPATALLQVLRGGPGTAGTANPTRRKTDRP